jgi:hypothetical protein
MYQTGSFIFIALLVLGGVFVAMVFGYTGFWLARNALSPVTRAPASVVRKRSNQWDVSLGAETPEMEIARLGMLGRHRHAAAKAFTKLAGVQDTPEFTLADGVDCYVTFRFDGREMEFSVPTDTYIACDEGIEGLLVYKGEKFKHFIRRVS